MDMSPTEETQPKGKKITLDQALSMVGQLINEGKLAPATQLCEQILTMAPQQPQALDYLGILAMRARQWDQALPYLEQAAIQQPHNGEFLNHYGHALLNSGQLTKAQQAFQESLFHTPGNFSAQYGMALTCLTQGNYEKGWRAFEWRFFLPTMESRYPLEKRWEGEPCEKLLLHTDDNAGHLFMMLRFLPALKKKVKKLLLEVGPEYIPLLKQCKAIDELIPKGNPIEHHDMNLSVMSIPNAIKLTLDDLPVAKNTIKSVKKPSMTLKKEKSMAIGLAWSTTPHDVVSSLPFEKLMPLINDSNNHCYSFQQGLAKGALDNYPSITDVAPAIKDHSDMAAFIDHCDLIITVDPTLAHLSGAMGKKTWVLLPKVASWPWLVERKDSPWYPSLTLFRQSTLGNWNSVMKTVIDALNRGI